MSRVRNLLLLAVLVACAVSFWWVRRDPTSTPTLRRPSRPVPTETGAPPPLRSVHVAVLNGTSEAGLARRFSRRLSELGCVVVSVADAPHDTFATTLLINRRLNATEVGQLATRLGRPRVLDEWDGRGREDAVLVLGSDHARLELKPGESP